MRRDQLDIKNKIMVMGLFLTLVLSACHNDDDRKEPVKTVAEKMSGIWEQQGYGLVLEVKQGATTEYEFTRATCMNVETEAGYFGLTEAELNVADITFSNNESDLVFAEEGAVFTFNFTRLSELPNSCLTNLVADTPVDTFKHFWNTLNDYYAFNSERGVDWAQRYASVIGQVSNDMLQKGS